MKNEELELYDTLDMCNWYRELLSMYNCDSKEIMRKHDRKVIEKIIQEFGYCSIYYSESKIFSIITLFGGIEFQCNFEIKDGLVNIYLISRLIQSEFQIGNSLIITCRMIEIKKNSDSGRYMLLPRFRNYEELHSLFRKVFTKYEEYKIAVFKSSIFI